MQSHPLAWTSLAPALTGGREVGGVALTRGIRTGRVAFAAAGHPPEVPLTCESGAQGGDPVGEPHADVGSKSLHGSLPIRSVANASSSNAVTGLVGLERWRGFCGGGQALNIEAAAAAAVQASFGFWPRSQDGGSR